MKLQFYLFLSSFIALILTSCGPGLAPATPTLSPSNTPQPSPTLTVTPTATSTSTPTVTPTPTSTPVPIPKLVNEYQTDSGSFQFHYPDGWTPFEDFGVTFVMPEVYAARFYDDLEKLPDKFTTIGFYRTVTMGDLFTDANSLNDPRDILPMFRIPSDFENALKYNPGESLTFENNGYSVYEITASDDDQNWYTAVILAKEKGVAGRVYGYATGKNWKTAHPYFMAMTRSVIVNEIQPVAQTDASLEGLILPGAAVEFEAEPYADLQNGFQVRYPQDWVVLEEPGLAVFSLDKEHSLCDFAASEDSAQCKTPVIVAALSDRDILDNFRQVSFDKIGDENKLREYFYNLLGNWLLYSDVGSIERFEVNGYPAIGVKISGEYVTDFSLDTPGNPITGYILAVKDNDKVAVLLSIAPTRFWGEFRPLVVKMLENFEFSAEPLPPSPTPTATPTYIPALGNQNPTADRFTFNGIEMKIKSASLGEDCLAAHVKIYPNEDLAFLHPFYEVEQPSGTNCIMVEISSLPGTETDPEQFQAVGGSIVGDPTTKSAYPSTIPYAVRTVMDDSGTYLVIDLYTFVPDSVTAFVLILPDIRMIPLTLKEK